MSTERGASKRGLFAAGLLGYLVCSFPTADLVSKYVTRRNGYDGVDLRSRSVLASASAASPAFSMP